SGIDSINIFFINKACEREVLVSLHENSGKWEGTLNLDENVQAGIYEVESIYATDKAENCRVYWSGYQIDSTEPIPLNLQVSFVVK
ncbi:MAG: hypothetical protein PUC30_07115, partial [Lachnospiraceae bacterium]|nr:hypothetical protein [Lachnospiraceae bacterium]